MVTSDIWEGYAIDQIHSLSSSSSLLSVFLFQRRGLDLYDQLIVYLVLSWHHTWLLKRKETKQKCASAKMGKEDEKWQLDRSSPSVVQSLLCLWPYGNSLIVCRDSEFYQCHTQNRRRYKSCPITWASFPSFVCSFLFRLPVKPSVTFLKCEGSRLYSPVQSGNKQTVSESAASFPHLCFRE